VATVKARRVGPDSVQLSVPIPVSSDGTAGRKCPECRRYFKVDGKGLASTATLWCAYCGARAKKDRFLTLDQRRRLRSAAAEWAYAEVHRVISGVFGAGRSIDAGLVRVSFEVGRAETIPLLSYVERETGRLLTCKSCGELSAAYGIAIFCPVLRRARLPRDVRPVDPCCTDSVRNCLYVGHGDEVAIASIWWRGSARGERPGRCSNGV
jgi:hypothetical protein